MRPKGTGRMESSKPDSLYGCPPLRQPRRLSFAGRRSSRQPEMTASMVFGDNVIHLAARLATLHYLRHVVVWSDTKHSHHRNHEKSLHNPPNTKSVATAALRNAIAQASDKLTLHCCDLATYSINAGIEIASCGSAT